ncbi:peroxidase [Daphnia magna]|uniref:peroxidase n=1 Tax=Daphnia magna TaxID=35525 RepID=UPI001E1BC1D0|nr:peroxidase [Daphnia magna]
MKIFYSFVYLLAFTPAQLKGATSKENGFLDIAVEDVQWAAENGLQRAQYKYTIELENSLLSEKLIGNKIKCPAHRKVDKKSGASIDESIQQSIQALAIVEASKNLMQRLNLNATEASQILTKVSLKNTTLEGACSETITCPSPASKYRSFDGSCNNLVQVNWGRRNTIYRRLLPAQYGNGIDSPRPATDGGELFNPRNISLAIIGDDGPTSTDITLLITSFGQFITHDITNSDDFTFENGSSPACCDSQGQLLPPNELHPQCLPIELYEGDANFNASGDTCMSFTRSKVGVDLSCTFGLAEQLNSNTHYLDGSQIYGSDADISNSLRTAVDGLLKSLDVGGRQLFPITPGCENLPKRELAVCFQAGDNRLEENPQLTAVHLLFLREHNRIAKELKALNPQWNDEILFQEARRIVIAQLQHITYNEYLPVILGSQVMVDSGLVLPTGGYGTGYDSNVDPSISNDFAAAAFRVMHSTIQGTISLLNSADEEEMERSFTLSQYFFNASQLLKDPGFFDSALRGVTKQPPEVIDGLYTDEVADNLFIGQKKSGGDLVAIAIQRGREHGIPSYNEFREFCGMPKVQSFDELIDEFVQEDIDLLKTAYQSVDDIDLYIGCLFETHVESESLMGPTALCITAEQFQKTKNGDRYFYDIGDQPNSFTPDQLDQIRQSSLARLMCDNNDGSVTTMQPFAMKSPVGTNQRIPCTSIPSMNLTYWKEI